MVLTIYYFFWVRYHPSKIYSQKKLRQETKYRPPFPPTNKPRPLNPLDRGPSSLVLAGYRLVVPRPFCACSTVFCVYLPRHFCYSKLALFWSATCFVLFLHAFPATFVIFLWFGFSFLHVIPTANTSCCSLFLFIVLLHISFHAYSFTQNNLGLCGPDNVDWIKRVLGPICLCLPKPFCQGTVLCGRSVFYGRFEFCYRSVYKRIWKRVLSPIYLYLPKPFCQGTVFCGRSIFYNISVFCCRFAFCCRLFSLAVISLDLSCSSVFLVGLWALLFIGFSSIWAFGHGFKKWASTIL